jgi:hypothetical protein
MGYCAAMSFTVNRIPIDEWIKEAYPNGLYKLSERSQIPASTLTKIRLGTFVPKNPARRKELANALGVKESELFIPAPTGKRSRAS